MNAAHTPGPWHLGDSINEYKSGSTWTVPVWADNGPEGGKIAAEAIAPTREMAQANARLISAVLELVEALRFAQKVIAKYAHGEEVSAGMILSVSVQMEAAIAKTEK
jgi:hypothetical protein